MAKRVGRREQQPRPPKGDLRQGSSDRAAVGLMDNEREEQSGPDPDAIARRAYEIYCEHGFENGRAMDHWLQAERELRNR